MRSIAPLLRRRGTSPEVGKALRRAVFQLDRVVGGLEGEGETRAVAIALAELSDCLAVIASSPRAADRAQADGATAAVAILSLLGIAPQAAAEEPTDGPNTQARAPEVPEVRPPERENAASSVIGAAGTVVVNGPRRNRESTREQLYKLGNLYWRRLSLVRDPAARWCDLVSVDRRIDRALLGLVWTGRRALEQGETSLIEASDDDESFAGSAALLASGGEAGASRVCGHIISAEDYVVGCVDALCVLNNSAALAPVEALFARTDRPEVRAGLLSYLAEKGRQPTLSLLALLDDPHDEVAIRAAELLARSGRTPHGCSAVEERARKKLPQERRCALLFAAVALGSEWALAECRRLVADGHAISMNIINALVVAGGGRMPSFCSISLAAGRTSFPRWRSWPRDTWAAWPASDTFRGGWPPCRPVTLPSRPSVVRAISSTSRQRASAMPAVCFGVSRGA